NLCGHLDEHIKHISGRLGIDISNRGNEFHLRGEEPALRIGQQVLRRLYEQTTGGADLTPETVHLYLQESGAEDNTVDFPQDEIVIRTQRARVKPRGEHQREYVRRIRRHDINFGVGPAGTGKTWP